jgi:hypothetical protein
MIAHRFDGRLARVIQIPNRHLGVFFLVVEVAQ